MEVGHPVTLPSGAHGIVARLGTNGMAEVDLLGGSTVRVPQKDLKSYFDNSLPVTEGKSVPTAAAIEVQSTRAQIISIIKASGDKRLAATEIYAKGNFAYQAQVSNELFQLYKKHAVLNREKSENGDGKPAVYKYWLVPGAKLPAHFEAAVVEEEVRNNGKAVTTHEFQSHEDSAVTVKGDELKSGHTTAPPVIPVFVPANIPGKAVEQPLKDQRGASTPTSAVIIESSRELTVGLTKALSILRAERAAVAERLPVMDKRIAVLEEWLREEQQ